MKKKNKHAQGLAKERWGNPERRERGLKQLEEARKKSPIIPNKKG